MFGQLMASIDDDYVKYVMHAQVQVMPAPGEMGGPALEGARYSAPEGPVMGAQAIQQALHAGPAPGEEIVFAPEEAMSNGGNGTGNGSHAPARAGVPSARAAAAAARASGDPSTAPKAAGGPSEFESVGRNDPCPCGSGKKFKFCHGR